MANKVIKHDSCDRYYVHVVHNNICVVSDRTPLSRMMVNLSFLFMVKAVARTVYINSANVGMKQSNRFKGR